MTRFTRLAPQFQSAKVLVTGAAGFLGMHLCGALLKNGAEVFAVSRTDRNGQRKDFHWLQADGWANQAGRHLSSFRDGVGVHGPQPGTPNV